MKVLSSLLFFSMVLSTCQQKSNTKTTTQNNTITMETDYPGYYVQINNQNCHYELRTNDFLSEQFFEPYGAYSVRVPINFDILESGKQHLQLTILPVKDTVLSERADITLKIMRYNNMKDTENEFGGFKEVFSWELPKLEPNLPVYVLDTAFYAEVPYSYTKVYKNAINLGKMDKEILLKEVVGEYRKMHTMLANKNAEAYIKYLNLKEGYKGEVTMYQSMGYLKEILQSIETDVLDEDYLLQPIENYHMVLYGNGRVVRLLRNTNNDDILWYKHKDEEGSELAQIMQLYKNKTTGKWQQW